jgi:hypothetical protein
MARSTRVACGCGSEMDVINNNAQWLEKTEDGTPYKLWMADHIKCHKCNTSIVLLAHQPYAINCQTERFNSSLELARAEGNLVE